MARPELVQTPSGHLSVRYGEEFLDDPINPVEAAREFIDPSRLDGAKIVILFGCGLGYRVASTLDAGARVVVYEPSPEIAEAATRHVPQVFEHADLFTDRSQFLAHLLGNSMAGQKSVLLVPPSYRRAFPEAHRKLVETMAEAEGLKQLRLNTLKERYQNILEASLKNLGKLEGTPLFSSLGQPLAGTPAFIVSAGPSLDVNGHLLAEASSKGTVFSVNTAAPSVAHHGAHIDVLTCVEALDVTASLEPAASNANTLAIDLSSAPSNFGVQIQRRFVFLQHSDPFHDLARALGGRVLPYGASVATAAFALARELGADPIVLIGQDLAFTDGRMYATGTGREQMRARLLDGPRFELSMDEAMLETFREKGIKLPPKNRPAIPVPAWGGSTVHTTHDLVLFLRWFEAAASRAEMRCINATEGGARIEGFEEARLEDLLRTLPDLGDPIGHAVDSAPGINEAQVATVRRELIRSARAIAEAAKKCLAARGARAEAKADAHLQKIKARSKYVELHATPALLKLREEKDLSYRARRQRTFSAIRDSARRVAELASATG